MQFISYLYNPQIACTLDFVPHEQAVMYPDCREGRYTGAASNMECRGLA